MMSSQLSRFKNGYTTVGSPELFTAVIEAVDCHLKRLALPPCCDCAAASAGCTFSSDGSVGVSSTVMVGDSSSKATAASLWTASASILVGVCRNLSQAVYFPAFSPFKNVR